MQLAKKGAALWITPDRLSVSIDQISGCEDGYRDQVSVTQVTKRQTKGVGVEAGIGGALLAGGGVALITAPSLSSQKSGGDQASPRETAIIWGAVAGVGGAILIGHALYIAAKGADDVSEPQLVTQRRTAGKPLRACGTAPAGPGVVTATVGARSIAIAAFKSGSSVVVEPRSAASRLCDEPADVNKVATLKYVLTQDRDLDVDLAAYPLRWCVVATIARQKVDATDVALTDTADEPTVIHALLSLSEARTAAESLPADDAERGELITKVTNLERVARQRAATISKELIDAARLAIEKDMASAVNATAIALQVARFAGQGAAAWRPLYATFTQHAKSQGVRGYGVIQQLLEADSTTWTCASSGTSCPSGIAPEEVRTVLLPLAEASSPTITKATSQLSDAKKGLAKQVNVDSVRRVDVALENVRMVREVCVRSELISPLDQNCASFHEADSALSGELTARASDVARARAQLEEAARAVRTARVTKAWKQHFSDCSRLTDAVRQLPAISTCDAGCRQVLQRMRAEKDRLSSFKLDDPIEDPAVEERLRDECGRAGCEVCP